MHELVIEQVTDRAAADRWHEVYAAAAAADYVDLPTGPVVEVYERIENNRADRQQELWLGSFAGAPVAAASLTLPMLDNTVNATVELHVHPSFRRRHYGTAMLDHLVDRARAHDRTRLIGEAGEPISDQPVEPPGGPAFAAAVGAKPVTTEVRRILRLAQLDPGELARLHDVASAKSGGYSLLQWQGPAADELVEDLAYLLSRMSTDAPLEDLDWEPEAWSATRYRDHESAVAASGRTRLVTVARHDASGRIVAFTDIGIGAEPLQFAYQWTTIVLAEHRGHRLGMLVKLANLAYLQRTHPKVEFVNTWNAGVNAHMVAINESLGFRPIDRWREWQLELSAFRTQSLPVIG
jgi:GNAT superfamily N-acetyltransferase